MKNNMKVRYMQSNKYSCKYFFLYIDQNINLNEAILDYKHLDDALFLIFQIINMFVKKILS